MNGLEATVSSFPSVSAVQRTKASVAVLHLGCEKNRVDTEHMLGLLAKRATGWMGTKRVLTM